MVIRGQGRKVQYILRTPRSPIDPIHSMIHTERIGRGQLDMLAAATSRSDRALETIKLVLVLEAQKQQYPEKLRNYFKAAQLF